MSRCAWAGDDPLMVAYHDREWGVPRRDGSVLFEFLLLEGAQAGLSWRTVLHKRENYRRLMHGFDARRIARYGAADIRRLLADPGIIRNRLKVASAVENAKRFLELEREPGGFSAYLWGFVGGRPLQNRFRSLKDIPPRTAASDAMSKDLSKRGFKFVGSTICYALMQAVGMVNDHLLDCPRHRQVAALSGKGRA